MNKKRECRILFFSILFVVLVGMVWAFKVVRVTFSPVVITIHDLENQYQKTQYVFADGVYCKIRLHRMTGWLSASSDSSQERFMQENIAPKGDLKYKDTRKTAGIVIESRMDLEQIVSGTTDAEDGKFLKRYSESFFRKKILILHYVTIDSYNKKEMQLESLDGNGRELRIIFSTTEDYMELIPAVAPTIYFLAIEIPTAAFDSYEQTSIYIRAYYNK